MTLTLDSPRAATDRWLPVNVLVHAALRAPLRSDAILDQIIDQFDVEHHARYQPGDDTYCNIFVWDVTRALGCEVPHWTLDDGTPARVGGIAHELDANGIISWLTIHGHRYGWSPLVVWAAAASWANEGKPAVAGVRAVHGHGHLAVVRPGACLAAAGRRCYARGTLDEVFPGLTPQYWGHE